MPNIPIQPCLYFVPASILMPSFRPLLLRYRPNNPIEQGRDPGRYRSPRCSYSFPTQKALPKLRKWLCIRWSRIDREAPGVLRVTSGGCSSPKTISKSIFFREFRLLILSEE
ncbi:hypothetical protein CDAR_276721 [Caerostris darwini]|uniref:Uncharacterized protein n=1 Tax=Caerostris darwini TaxID=1538125 RepID=A0AAV4NZU5_9ARAC|nr:hypothetical protein CDAR_276721 [Caerostris darwini]